MSTVLRDLGQWELAESAGAQVRTASFVPRVGSVSQGSPGASGRVPECSHGCQEQVVCAFRLHSAEISCLP
jgi:hypothetical protein